VLNLSTRTKEIHAKGFSMGTPRSVTNGDEHVIPEIDYSKIKVGVKNLSDAIIDLGSYKKINPRMTKDNI
jgi:hypothetical protein